MAEPGSWKPDPDDPERLRWRTDAGEWTNYTAVGGEVATTPVKPERKRRKWPWIVLACVVALAVTGVVSESEDEQPSAARLPEAAPATTTAIAPATTRPAAEQCQIEYDVAATFGLMLPGMFEELEIAFDNMNVATAQDTYNEIKWIMDGLADIAVDLERRCGTYLPAETATLREAATTSEQVWIDFRADCRENLASIGFDC